jgi:hypothetical protein
MAAYKGKKLAEMHGAERAARIKQLLASPGTRKLVPTADLPTSYRHQRELNTRLNSPIVQGGTTTQRDLAHSREAAVTTQFGPNAVGAYQQREKDTGGWFDEFQRRIEQFRQNEQGYGQQADAQVANLGNVQGPAGSTPQDAGVADDAKKAAAVRSAILGAMQGQIAGQSRAANSYADTLANVVVPGQKVQALTQARGATDELKGKIGAFRTQFESDAKTAEGKDVLARQALGINATKAAADIASTTTSTTKTQADIDFFNKHGFYPPTGPPTPKSDQGYGPGKVGMNKYGYTYAEWTKLSPKAQANARAGKGKPKAGDGAAPEWLTNEQMGAGLTQVVKLKDFALKAKTGQPFVPGHKPQGAVDRSEAAKKIYANAPSLKDPALLTAALDAAYDGHLSSATVKKLIAAGYKPAKVAQALGVPTSGQIKKGGGQVKPKIPPLNLKPLKAP